MAKITFFIPDQQPAKYDLSDELEISIGRASDCSIILDHGSVSSHHAVIRQIGGGLHVLLDNNSTDGIYLEGERVNEAPLANGASFMIGSVPAEYEGDDASVAHQSAPASNRAAAAPAETAAAHNYHSSLEATVAAVSTRPPGFKDLSPVAKVVKKNTLATVAMIMGVVAILAAIALAVISATVMSVG